MRAIKRFTSALLALCLLMSAACQQNSKPDDSQASAQTSSENKEGSDQPSDEAQSESKPEESEDKPDDSKEGGDKEGDLSNLNKEGFPIVKEQITLTAMVNQTPVQPDWNEIMIWPEYEKMTNIDIEWESVPSSSVAERRNLALATDDLPDLFYRAGLGEADIAKYGPQGSFIKLNDLIDEYAPNFKKILDDFEDVRKGIPMADGNIYAFPGLSNTLPVEINPKLYMNTKWLQQINKELPTSTDELYDVLKAMKGVDFNGNGQDDEIPWSSSSVENILRCLRGAWGLQNRGFSGGHFDIDPETEELRFIPISDQYKEMITFVNKLYAEGLIDKEIFTMNLEQVLAKNESEQLGAFSFTNTASSANKNEKDFKGLEVALKGPHGDQMWTAARAHVAGKGGFIITSANKHPEASVRWIDYFYSEEGAKMAYMGIEGKSYEKVGENEYKILDEIANNIPEGSSYDQVISAYVPYAGGGLPSMSNEMVFKGGEMQPIAYEAAMNMKPFIPEERWAPFSYSVEEAEENAEIWSEMGEFINTRQSEFIQGTLPMSEFENFVEEVKNMRLDEYMENVQAAYERYQAN